VKKSYYKTKIKEAAMKKLEEKKLAAQAKRGPKTSIEIRSNLIPSSYSQSQS
jgi:hypothetical protein